MSLKWNECPASLAQYRPGRRVLIIKIQSTEERLTNEQAFPVNTTQSSAELELAKPMFNTILSGEDENVKEGRSGVRRRQMWKRR